MKRYQECNRLEKIWRHRGYFLAPFIFLYKVLKGVRVYEDEEVDGKIVHTDNYFMAPRKLIWSIVISNIQRKYLNLYYTSEEVFASLDEKREEWRINH